MSQIKILAFDTEGNPPGNFEDRLRNLLSAFDYRYFKFDRSRKLQSFWRLLGEIKSHRPQLVVMEGTGSLGGLACFLGRWVFGVPYVFSSGDAVAPFLSMKRPWLAPIFFIYEWLLYYWCRGFIGWTPYLTGRALTLGARRTVVAAGWSPFRGAGDREAAGRSVRDSLGIGADALVVGLVGSLQWNPRVGYCYGLEVVRALKKVQRADAVAVIVGGGEGLDILKHEAGELLGKRIFLVGPKPRSELVNWLSAMDVGSLPQSLDGVGSFRYTTKISEYIEAELPFVTGPIPLSYDFGSEALWRVQGDAPWTEGYAENLAQLLDGLSRDQITLKRKALSSLRPLFDRDDQVRRVTEFVRELV